MKISFNIPILFCTAAIMLLPALSCKKKELGHFEPDRMFMPGDIKATNGETQVILEWAPSLFTEHVAEEYTVEIAEDQQFQGPVIYSVVTDSNAVIITDAHIPIKTTLYARVKANATGKSAESYWVYSDGFQITGEQIFQPIHELKLKDKSVVLTWRATNGLTKIMVTPDGGTPVEYPLNDQDRDTRSKLIDGLTPETPYTAEIFQGTVSKGFITFTTRKEMVYAVVLSPGDDLAAAVAAAADGDVIALQPGVYDINGGGANYVNLVVQEKTVSIVSVSDDPTNTKVNFKEITLRGTGAGIKLRGIEFDGAPANTAGDQALYFLNLTGPSSDAGAAQFTDIIVENCIVHDMGNCFLRGNRAANNDHKINSIVVNYCDIYNSATINNNYTFFQINKLEFASLQLRNSTLYRLGRGLIDWDANISTATIPEILVHQCTINSLGQAGLDYCLIDLNSNVANVTFRNSIIANIPLDGQTVGDNLARVGNATCRVTHCNIFNLSNGAATPKELTFPGTVALENNKAINLNWTGATTDFTLPPGHELRTSGNTGGPVGDPKWAQ
jgi:hypothetical protein